MLKRAIDISVSLVLLTVALPILLLVAISIRLSSIEPVFFRQARVGRHGIEFQILKFRTMRGEDMAPKRITVGRDPRITSLGYVLRQTKLDELPQLINVLRGDMSLVGPRPEVSEYVNLYPTALRDKVLSVRPGITDMASIKYRSEAELLAMQKDPDSYYRSVILPDKLNMAADYVNRASIGEDFTIIIKTIKAIIYGAKGQ